MFAGTAAGQARGQEAKAWLPFRVKQTIRRMKGMVVTFNVTGGEQGQWAVLQVSGELDLVTSPVLR